MTNPYEDIIHLSRPESRRAKMTLLNRAAQFAPFAALTGHDAVIRETGRLTQNRKTLDENEKARLNQILCILASRVKEKPEITVTYFQPDDRKSGGAYLTFTGALQKIDPYETCLCFTDGTQIGIEEIIAIEDGFCIDFF